MPSATYDEALDRAAEPWGIQPDYWDIWGKHHVTSPETKRAILQSLGIATDTKEELDEAAGEQRLRAEWSRLVPPCLVISENQRPREFAAHLPAELAAIEARVVLKLEDGVAETYHVALGELPVAESAEFNGSRYVRKLVPLPDRIAAGIPRHRDSGRRRQRVHAAHRHSRPRLSAGRTAGAPASPSRSTACAPSATGAAAIFAISRA